MKRTSFMWIVGLCALVLTGLSFAAGTPSQNQPLYGSKVSITTRSAMGAHESGLNLATDGGALELIVDGGRALSIRVPVTCSLAFGATDAGKCDDVSCTVTGANTDVPCLTSGPATQTADTTLSCYSSAADTVQIRRCCQRHAGNSGADCAAVSAANYRVFVLP